MRPATLAWREKVSRVWRSFQRVEEVEDERRTVVSRLHRCGVHSLEGLRRRGEIRRCGRGVVAVVRGISERACWL